MNIDRLLGECLKSRCCTGLLMSQWRLVVGLWWNADRLVGPPWLQVTHTSYKATCEEWLE